MLVCHCPIAQRNSVLNGSGHTLWGNTMSRTIITRKTIGDFEFGPDVVMSQSDVTISRPTASDGKPKFKWNGTTHHRFGGRTVADVLNYATQCTAIKLAGVTRRRVGKPNGDVSWDVPTPGTHGIRVGTRADAESFRTSDPDGFNKMIDDEIAARAAASSDGE